MMTFSMERSVKAVRKACVCDGCKTTIAVGEPAWRWSGIADGDFGTCVYHPDCRTAEVAYNKYAGTDTQDDWSNLDEAMAEDGDGVLDWLREKHPTVAARFEAAAQKEPGQ